MNYRFKCPDCKRSWTESTTGDYEIGDTIECPGCGRVSRITDITPVLTVEVTGVKMSPTKLEEINGRN